MFVLLLWCLFLILRSVLHRPIGFPQYFRNDSMRVVPGQRDGEFDIEILQSLEPGTENWVQLTTINGWQEVRLFVLEEERKQRAAMKKKYK